MASNTLALTSFLITLNLLFFTLVSSTCPPPTEGHGGEGMPPTPASPPSGIIPLTPTPMLSMPPTPASSPPSGIIPLTPTPMLSMPPTPASPPGGIIPLPPSPMLSMPPTPASPPGEACPPTPSTAPSEPSGPPASPPKGSCGCEAPPPAEGNGGPVTSPTPSPMPSIDTCPTDTLKLGVCGDILSLVNIVIGNPSNTPCCTLIGGLTDLDAALCLCTAIKTNILGINLNVPVSLNLLLNYCGKKSPSGFQCA